MSSLGSTWAQVEINFPVGGLNKSDTSIWNKFKCVPYGIKSTTFVNRNWFDTPIWNNFVTFVCYLE
jgi:hypothetical protein